MKEYSKCTKKASELLESRIQLSAWTLSMHSSSWTDQGDACMTLTLRGLADVMSLNVIGYHQLIQAMSASCMHQLGLSKALKQVLAHLYRCLMLVVVWSMCA